MAEIGWKDQKMTNDIKVGGDDFVSSGLYVVATPIGNLKDLSERAKHVLKSADLIACEDSRTSKKLMSAYLIKTPLVSYHEHSDDRSREKILDHLRAGKTIALISDAGTPLISDPGYKLVADARTEGINIVSIPGPSAVVAALSIAGLPTDRFLFMGFAPNKSAARISWFETEKDTPASLVYYESARRLTDSLRDASASLGEREGAVCRELTKRFEEVQKGSFANVIDHYDTNAPKGEVVVVIGPPAKSTKGDDSQIDDMLLSALKHMSVKSAAGFVADYLSLKRKEIYKRALELSSDQDD